MKNITSLRNGLLALALFAAVLFPVYTHAADSATASVTETAKETTAEAKAGMETLGKKISENRLIHRTPTEIATWVLIGVLVGSVVGFFSAYQATLPGRLLLLVFGLAGAFIGGMVARVGELDFGWPVIQIPMAELMFSFGGALLLIGLIRFTRKKVGGAFTKKKEEK